MFVSYFSEKDSKLKYLIFFFFFDYYIILPFVCLRFYI